MGVGADACLLVGEGKSVVLGGDQGYRADWIDDCVLDRGIQLVIPTQDNQDRAKRPAKVRPRIISIAESGRTSHRMPQRITTCFPSFRAIRKELR